MSDPRETNEPSENAARAVEEFLHAQLGEPDNEEAHADLAYQLLGEAHDPALGLDRSICLRELLGWIDRFKDERRSWPMRSDFEREFGR